MSIDGTKYSAQSIIVLIIICFTISLFWCGDADCINGTSNDTCASLVCAFLGKHNTASNESSTENAAQCTCLCHVPIIEQVTEIVRHAQSVELALLPFSFAIPSAPTKVVYRPPIAA
ncbi:MAG: hypothetical protein HW389_1805 [Bacteroidetes bacterium]|nr:hypothetical protein [Bacteroidota bacterium]MBM2840190.1 hypothetical protein [Bacteroidota bacterium]